MRTRDAVLADAQAIYELIAAYSGDGTLLPRRLPEICENIRDFVVAEEAAQIIGCGALHLYGPHLAEVRSVAVYPHHRGGGAGRQVVEALLREAERHHVSCVCLFTRIPDFFSRLGFSEAPREHLPDKVYKDCCNCPRLHSCDEIPMVRGQAPKFAILPRPMMAAQFPIAITPADPE